MKDDENENAVKFILPSGAEPGSSFYKDYAKPMLSLCVKMSGENVSLAERAIIKDFDPARELDFTANGCWETIENFFEIASQYAETAVPQEGFENLLSTFHYLIDSLLSRPEAPEIELDDVATSFRSAIVLLMKKPGSPTKPRRIYLRILFERRDVFTDKLGALHKAYVRAKRTDKIKKCSSVNKKRKISKRLLTVEQYRNRKDEKRVLDEIARLHDHGKGMSVAAAVRYLRTIETWRYRMSGVADDTWRSYFSKRKISTRSMDKVVAHSSGSFYVVWAFTFTDLTFTSTEFIKVSGKTCLNKGGIGFQGNTTP